MDDFGPASVHIVAHHRAFAIRKTAARAIPIQRRRLSSDAVLAGSEDALARAAAGLARYSRHRSLGLAR
jgi:hypothetical protein